MVTLASSTVSYTLAMHYFYRGMNNFSNDGEGGWTIIPNKQLTFVKAVGDEGRQIGPGKKDWLLANVFVFIAVCSFICYSIFNHKLYQCIGVHNFLAKLS